MELNMRAPNVALFIVAGCLAVVGVLCALPIPDKRANNLDVRGVKSPRRA